MKKINLLILILNLAFSLSYGQYGDLIYSTTIDFEADHYWIHLDTSINENIWRIGMPSKIFFDSAYSIPNAIITDPINNYPINNFSYYTMILYDSVQYEQWWGEGILGFWHKYDTETNKDGCYLEISYDEGNTWTNIVEDINCIGHYGTNFYSITDTLIGGIPAFSGNSGSWVYSEYYWFWLALTKDFPDCAIIIRFVFNSDSIPDNKEGWIIDHIHFNGYEIMGGIENNNLYERNIKVFPIPAKDYFIIEFNNNNEFAFELFDNLGRQIMRKEKIKTNKIKIDNRNLDPGIYYYRLFSNNKNHTGKILIEK